MKTRDLIKLLNQNGWTQVRQKGSHKQFKHATNPNLITVPDHPGDLKPGTLADVLKKAGIER
jgi:predicted RNA binding protein YcfA (HicA-like mRNA interferase family)